MRRALNIPNKLIRSHPVSDLLDILDWTDLRTRRQQHRRGLAFCSLRGDVPPTLLTPTTVQAELQKPPIDYSQLQTDL